MEVGGYYVTGLKALAAARERSRANEGREESRRLVMGLVEELSEARSELVGSRWQVVAARFEVVQLWLGVSGAKQVWIDSFGKGFQDFHDARRVLQM